MEGTSVLAQNKKPKAEKKAAPAAKAPKEGESVLGGSKSADKKPITFYKKAWFWIIIAVVVLGIAGLIVWLVIQSNITAEAIEKYGKNANAASTAVDEYESAYASIYSDSGLAGYYRYKNDDTRASKMLTECIKDYDVDREIFDNINDLTIFDGERAVDEFGSGKTRELSEKFEKAAENLKKAKAEISKCEEKLKQTIEDDYDIEFGKFNIIKGRYWDDSELKVTVKNTSDTSIKFYFKIEAHDADDNLIDSDTFYTKTLDAGASGEYTIFDYVSSSKYEKMSAENVKYVVVKVEEN